MHLKHQHRHALRFVIAYGLCVITQGLGKYFTDLGMNGWYQSLDKSPLTPPGYIFAIMWTALYFLMALAAARIAKITGQWNNRPLRWWLIQLFTGLVWTMVFFGHRDAQNGLYLLLFNWLAIAVTLLLFWRVNRRAGMLLVPLLAWVSFAVYLNAYIVQHN